MSETKDVNQIPGEATPKPDHTEINPGEGPGIAAPTPGDPGDEDTKLGAGPGS